jgi:hypothetical protein
VAVGASAGALPGTGSTTWGWAFGSCGTVAWIKWWLPALEPQPTTSRAVIAVATSSLIA